MGFYDLKEQPVPVTYSPLKKAEEDGPSVRFVRDHLWKVCCCNCCFILVALAILLLIPCSPVFYSVADKARLVMATEASGITGVKVKIDRVGLALSQADVFGMEVSNPWPLTSSTPYFMKCDHIVFDVNWIKLFQSSLDHVEIEHLTMRGLTVYIEQKVKVGVGAKTTSNGNAIQAHIGKILAHMGNGTSSSWAESFVLDEKRRFMVKTMNVQEMRVQFYMNALAVRTITVPPMVVRDIGAKQLGVSFEELFDLIVQSLSVVALKGEDNDVQANIAKTMNRLH